MDGKQFLNATDVARQLGVSKSMAYRIIKSLNEELRKDGYLTISGRVSRKYFERKLYAPDIIA